MTSAEWLQQPKYAHQKLLGPDGWDRSNYEHSFNVERISEEEFGRRMLRSTVAFRATGDIRTPWIGL
jgi:hypothetical protein